MTDSLITCCFTGHRPMKLPWGICEADDRCLFTKQWISDRIEDLYLSGYKNFICGMAIGCDTYFAEEVIKMKRKYKDVKLIAAVPCIDQSRRWNKRQKEKYSEILAQCDEQTTFHEHYIPGCMQQRNRYMVDSSSALIACYDGAPGGTMKTLCYAQKKNLNIIMLDISQINNIR